MQTFWFLWDRGGAWILLLIAFLLIEWVAMANPPHRTLSAQFWTASAYGPWSIILPIILQIMLLILFAHFVGDLWR